MWQIVVWVLFGWIAGSVAMWLVPPKRPVGGLEVIGVGVAGSIVGGMASSLVSGSYYSPGGLVCSVVGAVAVVFAWRWYTEST